jgi:hypothetical protein
MNQVDLFVVGSDFYSGSTRKEGRLKDGWCDFRVLGNKFAYDYFGPSAALGKVWYFATRVSPSASRSFLEHERQQIWLDALDLSVTRKITDAAAVARRVAGSESSQGSEFSDRPEDAAFFDLRRDALAPQAMVISANGGNSTPLLSFLNKNCECQPLILVPPDLDLPDDGSRLPPVLISHQDLEAARIDNEALWRRYEQSRRKSRQAASWLENASDDLGTWLNKQLRDIPFRHPEAWKKKVQLDLRLQADLKSKVARFLTSPAVGGSRPADDRVVVFIAGNLLTTQADFVFADRTAECASDPLLSIYNGRDLIDHASQVYPKLEIGDDARRQILELNGNEKHFNWLVKAFATANREMQNWTGGRFPHDRLPDSSPESETVMNNTEWRRLRQFKTHTGKYLLFTHHMKCHGPNIRVYYDVDPDGKVLRIGYVGGHLATPRYRT